MPSNVLRRCIAAAPRAVLCGIMPRTVRQKIFDGARKWKGPIHKIVSTFNAWMEKRIQRFIVVKFSNDRFINENL